MEAGSLHYIELVLESYAKQLPGKVSLVEAPRAAKCSPPGTCA